MKIVCKLLAIVPLLLVCGCHNHYQGDVVKETYIHKYGVPVSATDWNKQGKDGEVVQLQKDGITVKRAYVNGIQHGETTWSFPNSDTIARVETFASGVRTCLRDNYASGTPMQEEHYDCDGFVTKLLRWHEDGTPSAVEIYEHGKLVSGEYRNPLNVIESRVQDGEGLRICRNSEGEVLTKDTIAQGEMVERTNFYSNGDPCSITPYLHGKVHGERLTFYRGGLPKAAEQWLNDQQEGITTLYHNGEKVAEIPFIAGKKHGVELRYRDGSHLVEEVTWCHDAQHGPHKIYVDDDIKTEWYHQGEIVSRPAFERLNPPKIER
ncbi:MAG: toxin-antitoxin system YwqK family antitoxin [Verrucomicrobia bacterium]|nr:toxin-antitoxin system YwqK family antitoxin [Verrucomicrobiota bacterium]MBS0646185.1 toxin-antitoxin system YwqK family antitoxin [Verrucomicrobiota bacterium]